MANPRIRKVEGRWEVVMDAGTRADGSRKQIRRRFPTRRAAEDFRTKTLNEVRSGSYVEPSRELFGDYFSRWILDRRGDLKPASVYVLKNVRTRTASLHGYEIGQLTPAIIQAYVVALQDAQYAPTTISKTFAIIKQALRDAVAFRLIPANPCERVRTPKVPARKPARFTSEEVAKFRAAAVGTERHVLFETAIETGLRQGEIAALRIASVDLERRVLHVRETQTRDEDGRRALGSPKSAAGLRTLAVSVSLAELLRGQVEVIRLRQMVMPGWNPDDLLFPNREGRRESNQTANEALKTVCRRAGVRELSWHSLRHTNGSQLAAAGVSPKVIAERLGHEMVTTTFQLYVHPEFGENQDAADALEARFRAPRDKIVTFDRADRQKPA